MDCIQGPAGSLGKPKVSQYSGLGCIQVYPNSWTSSRYPSSMDEFLRVAYGDPCRECGFDWSVEPATCVAIVSDAPTRFTSVLAGHDGRETHPNLQWNATAYVVHVADVLRILVRQACSGRTRGVRSRCSLRRG